MGKWKSKRGHVSDIDADIVGSSFALISLNQEPLLTLDDLADLIEFVSRGALIVEVHEKAKDKLMSAIFDKTNPTIPNRGQINPEHNPHGAVDFKRL